MQIISRHEPNPERQLHALLLLLQRGEGEGSPPTQVETASARELRAVQVDEVTNESAGVQPLGISTP